MAKIRKNSCKCKKKINCCCRGTTTKATIRYTPSVNVENRGITGALSCRVDKLECQIKEIIEQLNKVIKRL